MFEKVDYNKLNARQQENYNYHFIAARMALYGFNCLRLSDDWNGADFIALHADPSRSLRVQLKARFAIDDRKYAGKGLHVAFRSGEDCYVYPHDEVVTRLKKLGHIAKDVRARSWPYLTAWAKPLLAEYKV